MASTRSIGVNVTLDSYHNIKRTNTLDCTFCGLSWTRKFNPFTGVFGFNQDDGKRINLCYSCFLFMLSCEESKYCPPNSYHLRNWLQIELPITFATCQARCQILRNHPLSLHPAGTLIFFHYAHKTGHFLCKNCFFERALSEGNKNGMYVRATSSHSDDRDLDSNQEGCVVL